MGVGVPSGGTHFEKKEIEGVGVGHWETQKKNCSLSERNTAYVLLGSPKHSEGGVPPWVKTIVFLAGIF